MQNLKLLHVISSIDNGGAENQIVKTAVMQKKQFKDVMIVYFFGNDYWLKYLKKKKIKTIKFSIKNKLNIFNIFFQFLALLKFCKSYKPNIIHAHLSISEIFVFFLTFFINFQFFITKHLDSFYFESSNSQNLFCSGKFLENLVLKKIHKIIFISQAVQKYFNAQIAIPKKKQKVVHYLINTKLFRNISQKKKKKFINKYKIKKNFYIIGCIARHVNQKNLFFLLKCFKLLNTHNKKTLLIMVGRGKLTHLLKKYSDDLGISNNLIWINSLNETNVFYNIIDIFFLPSKYEGLGVVFIEALSAGVPIIALNKSAVPEVVKNNTNGILINENEHEFLSAFKKLNNKKIIKKIFNNNIKHSHQFNIENKFKRKKYLEIYNI